MIRASEFSLDPPIRINGLRTLWTADDALALLREHGARPGVDDRDEVRHQLERAKTEDELRAAVARFRKWAASWGGVSGAMELGPRSASGHVVRRSAGVSASR